MGNRLSFESLYSGFLGIFAFIILVFPKPVALCFAVCAIFVVVGMKTKKMKFKADLPGLLLICFYLVYIVYISFTRNPGWAGTYAENKLSFVLLPLLFFFRPTTKISFRIPLSGFIVGALTLFVIGIINSYSCYSATHNPACWISSSFSTIHHPTYTSVFYTFSIGAVIYGYRQKWKGFSIWTAILISLIMIVGITLSLSLAGVLYMMIFFASVVLYFIYKRFGKLVAGVTLILLPLLGYSIIQFVPRFEGEYEGAKFYAEQYMADPSGFVKTHVYPAASGSEVRLIMWTASSQSFGEYPLGVGTGNVDGVLAYKLHHLGQHELAKKITDYNPHNQYLQTGLEIGIPGLGILLAIIIGGSYIAVKKRNWLLLLLLTCFAFNMLFESMLQRQSGIVFFSFVLCLLMTMSENVTASKKQLDN